MSKSATAFEFSKSKKGPAAAASLQISVLSAMSECLRFQPLQAEQLNPGAQKSPVGCILIINLNIASIESNRRAMIRQRLSQSPFINGRRSGYPVCNRRNRLCRAQARSGEGRGLQTLRRWRLDVVKSGIALTYIAHKSSSILCRSHR